MVKEDETSYTSHGEFARYQPEPRQFWRSVSEMVCNINVIIMHEETKTTLGIKLCVSGPIQEDRSGCKS